MRRGLQRGFTLTELVLVLVIIGVIAAVGAVRFTGTTAFEERGFHDELVSATRYAQRLAVATQCEVQVDIDTATDRSDLFFPDDDDGDPATCDGAAAGFGANPVPHPSEDGPFADSAPDGVDIAGGSLTFHYDALGEPSATGSVSIGGRTLTVEPTTGYVH